MRKLWFLSISFLGLIVIIGVIGFIMGGENPASSLTSNSTYNQAAYNEVSPSTPVPPPPPGPIPPFAPTPAPASTPAQSPATIPTPTPVPTAQGMDGVSVYYGDDPPYARNDCSPCGPEDAIKLVNNTNAADPTWQQLMSFLLWDMTDEKTYVPGVYVCGAFAEDLHNNAEAAEIRAAWVAVDFDNDDDGHALNAFTTTDRGLVYIDCTGQGWEQESYGGTSDNRDKVAYLAAGKEYGLISLDIMSCTGYHCYEEYIQRTLDFEAALEAYNQEVADHNAAVSEYEEWVDGRVFIAGTDDAKRMEEWYEELKQEEERLDTLSETLKEERDSLGTLWEPIGVVSSIEIYW